MKHLFASTHLTNELTNPEIETPNSSNAHLNSTKTRPCILVVENDPSVAELLKIALLHLDLIRK